MPALNPFSFFRRVLMALLVGALFLSSSTFANAQGQTTDPHARQQPPNGERSQPPRALVPAQAVTTASNIIRDPSFESAYNSMANWIQYSENFFTPLCIAADCGNGAGTAGPRTGSVWAWFGGVDFSEPDALNPEFAYIQQQITVPSCGATLKFYLWIGAADPGSGTDDYFIAQLGSTHIFSANATQKNSYPSYTLVTVDIPPGSYTVPTSLYFFSEVSDQLVTFNLDDISVVPNCLIISGNAGVEDATINYTGGSTTTSFEGYYSFNVPVGWSGTVTPSESGYTFSPASRTYTNLASYQLGQNYTATRIMYSISEKLVCIPWTV